MIIFRKRGEINLFRDVLHALIRLKGEELIITSGYVAEGPNFSLLDIENLQRHLASALSVGMRKVTVIGGRFSGNKDSYRKKYLTFIDKLKAFLPPGVLSAYETRNWHAKISMKVNGGKPIAALIGSSNLTTTAYGVYKRNFNHECDIAIWDNKYVNGEEFYRAVKKPNMVKDIDNSFFIYIKNFKEEYSGLDESSRLQELYEDMRKQTNDFEKLY